MHAPEPIARNLAGLSETVINTDADIGLATDGDSDRIGLVAEDGTFVNQHQVFGLLVLYLTDQSTTLKASTLQRRLVVIAQARRAAGYVPPMSGSE